MKPVEDIRWSCLRFKSSRAAEEGLWRLLCSLEDYFSREHRQLRIIHTPSAQAENERQSPEVEAQKATGQPTMPDVSDRLALRCEEELQQTVEKLLQEELQGKEVSWSWDIHPMEQEPWEHTTERAHDIEERAWLPPNQSLVAAGKWPVVGERAPRADISPWSVSIEGLVGAPRLWSLEECMTLPQEERIFHIHCVTRWSRLNARFGGFPLSRLLDASDVQDEARYVSFVARSDRAHSTSLSLSDVQRLDPFVAFTHEGRPLESIHGGPLRLIVPGRYFYKSLKWLEKIVVCQEDRPGYWENESGYHNTADPWREQRYITTGLKRSEVIAFIGQRDLSGKHLLSLEASSLRLEGLDARDAILRNADFRKANLCGASFAHANLSNAHFEQADLRKVSFQGADLEGASFCGADLRGADLRDASLFGASFCHEPHHPDPLNATIDKQTRWSPKQLETLTPFQQDFLRRWFINTPT